ncbi:E3 ubiquitin-protein ligase TRIM11-like [Corythoichthys intestinalis]|uniref:E3 ubiquitin-protein ligase TRIM11-like n=1 Tax=Corythoichthys intestinalis TaxID=161448 RepID=UPI0025A51F4C|nr:E3 ubiquitin-protein ligase TRIM11-like [Corythoichthys intestinalis]XP_057704227.1 E3 ubiquitin-protein ligase TRIM11-like [Corythoichthys intestinalis]
MAERLKDYTQCPGCSNIFTDPLFLPCGHDICRICLQQLIATEELLCQLCGGAFELRDPRPNFRLKAMCEDLSIVKSEDVCSLHKEELNFFCLDHQELVCPVCISTEIHAGHKFKSLKIIVKGHHKELQEGLQKANEIFKDAYLCKENLLEQALYIKAQRENVELKIRKEFKGLRLFLDFEEKSRLAAVEEEEKKKSRTIKEQLAALDETILVVSDALSSTEEQLRSGEASFMKNLETVMSKIQELPEKPQLLPGALLDEAIHVGNLKFEVWHRMRWMFVYSPVILDPNTANPKICLSEDLTSLSLEEVAQERPKNPERYQESLSVLGAALDPGRHVWYVEVGDNNAWRVGVVWGHPGLPQKMSHCTIGFRDGQYKKPGHKYGEWNPHLVLQRIRVEVDTIERSVSFFELFTNTQLWSTQNPTEWPDLSGNDKMFPYFGTADDGPLMIIGIQPGFTAAIHGHDDTA